MTRRWSAGAFGAGYRSGNEAEEVGDDRAPVSLVDEEVIGEIADVNGLDVLRVKALVDGTKHFQISFGKEILGISLLEKPQLGQAAPRESFFFPIIFSSFCIFSSRL